MRIETRRFKNVTNLLIISESEEDSKTLDKLGKLEQPLKAELRLADGYGEYYLMVKGAERGIATPRISTPSP